MADDTNTAEREVAEQWLRDRYGAYRGHFAWRELEEAFLAGRASLAASAGSEPVKRVFLVATGEEHEGEATYTRYDDAPPPLCDSECLYTHPSPPEGMAGGWKPLIEAPNNEIVLVAAEFDGSGDWRIKCGYLDEQTAKWRVFGASWEPTRWMPLPPPPTSAEGVGHV